MISTYCSLLGVPQEAQSKVRVPVARASSNNTIEQLWVKLCECHSLCTTCRTTIVERVIRITAVVCRSQSLCSWREETYGVVNPSSDLFLVVQVRQIYARLATTAIVLRSSMPRVTTCDGEAHSRVELCHHARIIDRSSHSTITDSHKSIIVLQAIR